MVTTGGLFGIQRHLKLDHLASKQLFSILNLDLSGIRIPTVLT